MDDKLKKIRKTIEESFGKGSVFLLNDEDHAKVDVIPTGIYSVDKALGCGGIPRGRIVEISGAEAAGKSSLCLKIVGNFQKQDLVAAYVDVENSLDLSLAEMLGVDVDQLLVSQPDSAEIAWEQIEAYVKTEEVGIIVLDSVAALVPQVELDGGYGDSQMGVQARLMGKAMRKITGLLAKTNTTLLLVNQQRQKIGVFFGSPTTTSGGNALKYYASLRLEVSKLGQLKDGETVVGHTMGMKVIKNKLAVPFKKAEVPILYGKGFDEIGDIIDVAIKEKLIELTGTTYSFEGEKLCVGKPKLKKYILENPKVYDKIVKKLKITPDDEKASQKV